MLGAPTALNVTAVDLRPSTPSSAVTAHGYRPGMSHVVRIALGVLLWTGLAGCVEAERLLQTDGCTLAVTIDTTEGKVRIEPPYVIKLTPPGVSPPTGIGFTGTGWTTVDITQISPEGVVVDTFRGEGVDDRSVVFPMDRPGLWTYRLVDLDVDCRREVKVTVEAPA
jgi:hypothetical protein